MAIRFYLVPKIGDGLTPLTTFRPKYCDGLRYQAMDYGREATMLVGADVTPAEHTSISANADVTTVPANLDSAIGAGALTQVQNALEALKLPGSWVTTSHTYRDVIGAVGRMCLLLQRFDGLFQKTFFETGITLGSTVSALTVAQRQDWRRAAESFGLPTDFITLGMTIRQVFRTWVPMMGPIRLMGEVF